MFTVELSLGEPGKKDFKPLKVHKHYNMQGLKTYMNQAREKGVKKKTGPVISWLIDIAIELYIFEYYPRGYTLETFKVEHQTHRRTV